MLVIQDSRDSYFRHNSKYKEPQRTVRCIVESWIILMDVLWSSNKLGVKTRELQTFSRKCCKYWRGFVIKDTSFSSSAEKYTRIWVYLHRGCPLVPSHRTCWACHWASAIPASSTSTRVATHGCSSSEQTPTRRPTDWDALCTLSTGGATSTIHVAPQAAT